MNFSPKVQPIQEETNNQSKNLKNFFFVKVLSGTNQCPPGLDELQPKSSASPGGNKLSIQKSQIFKSSVFWDKSISSWTR